MIKATVTWAELHKAVPLEEVVSHILSTAWPGCSLTPVTIDVSTSPLNSTLCRREKVLRELVRTEENYVADIQQIITGYKDR